MTEADFFKVELFAVLINDHGEEVVPKHGKEIERCAVPETQITTDCTDFTDTY